MGAGGGSGTSDDDTGVEKVATLRLVSALGDLGSLIKFMLLCCRRWLVQNKVPHLNQLSLLWTCEGHGWWDMGLRLNGRGIRPGSSGTSLSWMKVAPSPPVPSVPVPVPIPVPEPVWFLPACPRRAASN